MTPSAGPTSVLTVDDLWAGYGQIVALSGVDLAVGAGELVAVVGTNGAGKTTLLRVLSGQLAPISGRVTLDATDVTGARSDRLVAHGLVHVPEGRQVLGRLTVEENLRLGAFQRKDGPAVQDDIEDICRRFPALAQRRRQPGATLSGGEQQMLAIGRGLMARPKVVLLDEPSLGLAPLLVAQVFELIGGLRDDGLTILLVEQNARGALKLADRAYVIETGKVVLTGPAAELLDDPRVTRSYLGEASPVRPPPRPER